MLYVTAVGSTPFAFISRSADSAAAASPARTNPSTMVLYVCAFGATPSARMTSSHPLASSMRPLRASACTSAVYA